MGNRGVSRPQLVFVAGALLVFVVVQVALAGTNDGGPRASKSANLAKQVRQLKQRVAALEAKPDQVGQVPATLPPSGSAGGDLMGSYPNPLIGPNAVGSPEVGTDALGGADIDESTLSLAGVMAGRVVDVGGDGSSVLGGPSGTTPAAATLATVESMVVPAGTRIGNLTARNDVSVPTPRQRIVTIVSGAGATTLSCTITGNTSGCTDIETINVGGSSALSVMIVSSGAGLSATDDVSFGFTIAN